MSASQVLNYIGLTASASPPLAPPPGVVYLFLGADGITPQQINSAGTISGFGGGGGTVTVGAGLSGDGSAGNPLVNAAPFGANTNVDINNSAASPVHALNLATTLTTNTAGSEASKLVLSLLTAGGAVAALDLRPAQLLAANGSLASPTYSFQNSTNSGMYWDATNSRLSFTAAGGISGNPNMFVSAAGLTLEFATPGLYFHSDNANSIVRTAGAGMTHTVGGALTFNIASGNAAVVNIGGGLAFAVQSTKNVMLGTQSMITTATAGFACIAAAAGPPTGVVTPPAGYAALYADTANHKTYMNDGSGWVALN